MDYHRILSHQHKQAPKKGIRGISRDARHQKRRERQLRRRDEEKEIPKMTSLPDRDEISPTIGSLAASIPLAINNQYSSSMFCRGREKKPVSRYVLCATFASA
jgi:hypothetical protein